VVVDGYDDASSGNYSLTVEGPATLCTDTDAGSEVPATFTGSTVGAGDELVPICGTGADSEEVAVTWTAPSEGLYRFDTVGSSFDTILTAYAADSCALAHWCSDDADFEGDVLTSELRVALRAEEAVTLVVDGYATGDYELNVTAEAGGEGGACCSAHDGWGCDDAETELCVCRFDPHCCNGGWDESCAGYVEALGCGSC